MAELGLPQTGPTVVHQDNPSTFNMAEKGELGSKRTKHFTVRHYFVKEHLEAGTLELEYMPTDKMPADGLTKPLEGMALRKWAWRILERQPEESNAPLGKPMSSDLRGSLGKSG